MALPPGTPIGPYVVSSAIGAGGMGEVYRARDTRLGRDVALKVLPAASSADPDRLQRFEQEARAIAALNHPNILALYDVGQTEGGPFIVTELLDGETLRAVLDRGAMSIRKATECAVQVARGLAAAHERGIVQRWSGLNRSIVAPVSTWSHGRATQNSEEIWDHGAGVRSSCCAPGSGPALNAALDPICITQAY